MLKPIMLVACIAFLTGCSAPQTTSLTGTTWRLAAIGAAAVMRPAAGSTLTFDTDGTGANGTGPCNSFGTTVTVEGAELSFGRIIATERACFPDTRMLAEAAYFDALERAVRFEADDASLALFDAAGREVLSFEAVEAAVIAPVENDLIGTRWALGDLEGSPAFGLAHIAFGENGELDGQGPCNSFAGDYRLGEGAGIYILPRETTRCFCDDFERERQFFDALRRVSNWRIDGERLLLGTGGDATVMILESERTAPLAPRGC